MKFGHEVPQCTSVLGVKIVLLCYVIFCKLTLKIPNQSNCSLEFFLLIDSIDASVAHIENWKMSDWVWIFVVWLHPKSSVFSLQIIIQDQLLVCCLKGDNTFLAIEPGGIVIEEILFLLVTNLPIYLRIEKAKLHNLEGMMSL